MGRMYVVNKTMDEMMVDGVDTLIAVTDATIFLGGFLVAEKSQGLAKPSLSSVFSCLASHRHRPCSGSTIPPPLSGSLGPLETPSPSYPQGWTLTLWKW